MLYRGPAETRVLATTGICTAKRRSVREWSSARIVAQPYMTPIFEFCPVRRSTDRNNANASEIPSHKPTYRYRSEVDEVLSRRLSRRHYIFEESTSSCSGSEPDDGPTLSIRSPLGIIHFCSLVDQY